MSRQTTIILALALFATSAAATFSMSSIIKQAEVIKVNAVTAATNTAISVSTTIRGFAANDPYQIKNLSIPKATFMTRFKAGFGGGGISGLIKKNAWYAGWAATMAAAGWAIDELTSQVTQPNVSYTGQCASNRGIVYNMSLGGCHAYAIYGDVIKNVVLVNGPNPPVVGQTTTYDIYYCAASQPTYCYPMPLRAEFTAQSKNENSSLPVNDDAIYDSLVSYMLMDTNKAAQAFMTQDTFPYPYPDLFPSSVPYVPNVSQSDQDLLDLYSQGLLQSTNPNAANYVSPEKYAEIQALAAQLAQGATPEGQVNAANQKLKQPLTQAELEETLKKRDTESKKEADEISAIDKKPVTDAYKDSKLKDEYDKLKERVTDTSKLPQLPPLPASDQIDYPSYKVCRTITTNIFTGVLTFPSPDQCQKLEQIKTGLGYLLYLLTAMGIISELFKRVE